jgi:hypothetical protein
MKNLVYILIAFLLVSLVLSGCSKKPSSELIGKWKADSVQGMPRNLETEIFYEFTKDKIAAYGFVHGEPLDRYEIPYTVKSEEGKDVVLSVVHPTTGAAGEFKITINGKKMNLTDPDNKPFYFSKVE